MKNSERRSLSIFRRLLLILISVILLLLQIAFTVAIIILSYGYASGLQLFYGLITLGGIILSLSIIARNINTNYKLTWCILVLSLPIFFGTLYLSNLISRHISKKKRMIINNEFRLNIESKIDELKEKDNTLYNIASSANRVFYSPIVNNSDFIFFNDAKLKFDDMLNEIKNAKHSIFLEYFIISDGKLFDELYQALKIKGEEGIIIKVLYDSLGCRKSKKILKKLSTIKNCEVKPYGTFGFKLNLLYNYRNHRKLCIIDYNIAYCGGDNLADEYVHYIERFGYWRDNAGKYIGEAAVLFALQFEKIWFSSTKEKINIDYNSFKIDYFNNNSYIMPFTDGPFYSGYLAYDLFCSLIINAKKSIYISTPYFIVDDAILNLIVLKCKEGIDVKILMPNIPDKKTPFYMGREKYKQILLAGGKIYQYKDGFNHAKNIIIDDKYAYIGTVNMDYRSLYLHFECGALVYSNMVHNMYLDFMNAINISIEIEYEKWKKRPLYQKIIAFILNLFAPMF